MVYAVFYVDVLTVTNSICSTTLLKRSAGAEGLVIEIK